MAKALLRTEMGLHFSPNDIQQLPEVSGCSLAGAFPLHQEQTSIPYPPPQTPLQDGILMSLISKPLIFLPSPFTPHLLPPLEKVEENKVACIVSHLHSQTPRGCVCCSNNNSFHPHILTPLNPFLPLLQPQPTTSPCSSALSGSRAAAHSDESHASEEKFSTLQVQRGSSRMRGRHPASRGTEDVAPYQSDEADLISEDV